MPTFIMDNNGTTGLMKHLDQYKFPEGERTIEVLNRDHDGGFLVSKIKKEECISTLECVDKGIYTPWTSKLFPGWNRLYDNSTQSWLLWKDHNYYMVSYFRN